MDGGKSYIFYNRHIVEQIELLENHSHMSALNVYIHAQIAKVVALEKYITVGRVFKHIQTAQKGAFSAAGRSYNSNLFTLINFFVYVVQNG